MRFKHDPPLIGLVGVCASGKSTLTKELTCLGYSCRHIAQEHSYVPDMWQRLTNPDFLVYLEVSYANTLKRRNLNWTMEEFEIQVQRLEHAHRHADQIIDTNYMSITEIVTTILENFSKYTSGEGR